MIVMCIVFLILIAIGGVSFAGRKWRAARFSAKWGKSKNRLTLRYFNEPSLSIFDMYYDICLYG